jgi:hypothetical protein
MDKSTKIIDRQVENSKINHSTTLFNLSDFNKKKVEVNFNREMVSNDGGLLLLREIENQIGLIKNMASCILDTRHQSYVDHSIESLLSQRIMQIAAGYEDANDCNTLRNDGVLKVCAQQESALASQPTMSRFENQLSKKELYNIAKVFIDNFIASYQVQPEVIILDCDDTDAILYGQQELGLFNSYYDDYCYMPLHIYEGLSGKLIATILKPGRRSKSANVFAILKRIIQYLRKHWPDTIIMLRGDSHFCSQEFMDWSLNKKNIEFLTGIAGNSVLKKCAQITIDSAEREYKATGKPVKRYHSFEYKAGTWNQNQRVIVKVEVTNLGTNVRYIASSIRCIRAKVLYENAYCARGAAELRIKDHKTYLLSDRMSCSSFFANQLRLFMHSAAYVLIHTLQKEVLKGTSFVNATMKTIQLKIIKVATHVKILKSKVLIELPVEFYSRWVYEKMLLMFNQLRT